MHTRIVVIVTALVCLAACGTVATVPAPPSGSVAASSTTTPDPVPESPPSSEPFPSSTIAPIPSSTVPPSSTTVVPTSTTPPRPGRVYPWHTNIVSTTFWVGEIYDPQLPDGSQVCSTYDSQWAFHWSGVRTGTVPSNADGCPGSPTGGCDGAPGKATCATEARHAENGWFPVHPTVVPKENPFYLDLPFDDINDTTGYATRCTVIPWANDPGYAGKCTNGNFSYMKNRWVRIQGPSGRDCYGQVEDAGPSHGNLYHDSAYVFGAGDKRPVQGQFNDAGMDVSPALNGCLGFAELDGENDHVKWAFTDTPPPGPWTKVVTTSGVTP